MIYICRIDNTNPLMNDGTTILHCASSNGHVKIVNFLYTIHGEKFHYIKDSGELSWLRELVERSCGH